MRTAIHSIQRGAAPWRGRIGHNKRTVRESRYRSQTTWVVSTGSAPATHWRTSSTGATRTAPRPNRWDATASPPRSGTVRQTTSSSSPASISFTQTGRRAWRRFAHRRTPTTTGRKGNGKRGKQEPGSLSCTPTVPTVPGVGCRSTLTKPSWPPCGQTTLGQLCKRLSLSFLFSKILLYGSCLVLNKGSAIMRTLFVNKSWSSETQH